MDDLDFILALMRQNTNELGFIPSSTIETHYLRGGQFIIQNNHVGKPVGYLLHGKPTPGGILTVAQHCIEMDKRDKGYGRETVEELIERAQQKNCRAVKLRCAEGLPSNEFWQALGFELTNTVYPDNSRKRAVNVYMLDLWPVLIK